MDLVGILGEQLERTGRLVAGVRPEHMDAPTPCPDFDVKALLNHLVGGHQILIRASEGAEIAAGSSMPDVIGDDPVGAYERSSKEVLEMFKTPGIGDRTFSLGTTVSGNEALGIALMESVVHAWDLATATGQKSEVPPELAAGMLQTIKETGLVDGFRNPEGNPFGPEIEVGEDASPIDKLVAYLGRTP